MLLVHRSPRGRDAVRTVSGGGALFVLSVVACMILASVGDALDPAPLGEAGLELAALDGVGEFSLLALHQWHLLQFLFAGAGLAGALALLQVFLLPFLRRLQAVPPRAIDKVPI